MDKREKKYKSRGSVLVITALAAIVWIFIAQSLFIVTTSGFGMLKSSRVALQAQQYAEIEVDRLKNVAYENLDSDGAHSRQAIANIQESGWEDEVSIGSENSISGSDNAKQRIATINVYKSGDTLPRFTLEVPLSSQNGSISTRYIEQPDIKKIESAVGTGKGNTHYESHFPNGGVYRTTIWEDGWYQLCPKESINHYHYGNPFCDVIDPNGNPIHDVFIHTPIYLKKGTEITYGSGDIYHFTDTIRYIVQYN